ncbi:MAG: hypothetical protein H8E68_01595 [Kiritimatiellaeota bacterium]|nr:hypothetical protein [Kiritimatiellota bacterium]
MVSTTLHVFDGGLSVQEYNSSPQLSSLTTEFIRGEGMGGGVGGMVYSLKHPDPSAPNQEPSIICSHANHRGDVIARSDMNGALTSFALYEAYGTRPYEWPEDGSGDPDRQKANTKEEETDLGLLNEGMRYRDLDTGTFMTRDPIGYKDGPNIYCYVHCNPITKFDALGLWSSERSRDAAGNLNIKFIVTINIIDCRSNPNARLPDQFKSGISDQVKSVVESTYSGSGKDPTTGGNVTWSIAATVSFKDSVDDVKAGDIRSSLVDNIPSPVEGYSAKGHADPGKDGKVTGGYGHRVNMSRVAEAAPGGLTASAAAQLDAIAGVITHELGHNLGLRHPGENDPNNTMPSKSNEHDPQNNGSSLGTDNVMRTGKEASGLKTDTEQAIAIDKLAQERADEDKKEDKK